jgi:hypothetical protein
LVIQRLRNDEALAKYRALLDRVADAQLWRAVDAGAASWTEEDVVSVEFGDERRPHSLENLHLLIRRHLGRLGRMMKNDDFSYRALFNFEISEKEIQRWVASCLKLIGRGLYSVVRESELDDNNKVDISALVPGIGRIPIEIKPLGPYSLQALEDCIEDQLFGKYMKQEDIKYGVLLLIRLGHQYWNIGDKRAGFDELADELRRFANRFGAEHDRIITVETIDLAGIP